METCEETRKSDLEHGGIYFWTATINGWKHLLTDDSMKIEIIQSLQWLTQRNLVSVYAYVIMPNHLHFVWTIKENNGRESPQGSLQKFTAHRFRKILYQSQPEVLKEYQVDANNKLHEFWQRDSLA